MDLEKEILKIRNAWHSEWRSEASQEVPKMVPLQTVLFNHKTELDQLLSRYQDFLLHKGEMHR